MTDSTKDDLKQKIFSKMNGISLSSLSTITEDGRPWVRYVTPFGDEDLNLWFATFVGSRKVGQIQKNAEVHLTMGVTEMEKPVPYLQVQGKAEILTDQDAKNKVWSDHLSGIFAGPEDPNLCAVRITPYRIELQEPKPEPPQVWEP